MSVVDRYQTDTSVGAWGCILRCLFVVSSMRLRLFFVVEANKRRGKGIERATQVFARYRRAPKRDADKAFNIKKITNLDILKHNSYELI